MLDNTTAVQSSHNFENQIPSLNILTVIFPGYIVTCPSAQQVWSHVTGKILFRFSILELGIQRGLLGTSLARKCVNFLIGALGNRKALIGYCG